MGVQSEIPKFLPLIESKSFVERGDQLFIVNLPHYIYPSVQPLKRLALHTCCQYIFHKTFIKL